MNERVYKRRSRFAIFSSNGAQKMMIEHNPNHFQTETRYWQKSLEGYLVGIIQAGNFREVWVLESTKYNCQMDPFAFSNHQEMNQRDKITDCSL